MRVCLVHSFYRSGSPSGENEIVLAQQRLLLSAGHEVLLVSRGSDQTISSPVDAVRVGVAVAARRGYDPTPEILRFRPDIVHVHNLFPNIGSQWIAEMAERAPLVATLHNFRAVCAKGTLYREGALCELCLEGPLPALRHRCYRESALATLPLVLAQRGGLRSDPLFTNADRLIALTQRAAEIFVRAGADPGRLSVVPNGVEAAHEIGVPGNRWLYAGRLAEEKGVLELMAAWPEGIGLDVVGDGPLLGEVQRAAGAAFTVLGPLRRDVLRTAMGTYCGLVIPSRWAEGFPLVLAEALSAGTPVLALEGSGAADFISEFGGGLVYTDDDDLRRKVMDWNVLTDRQEARGVFDAELSESAWLERLLAIYEEVAR